MKRSRERRILQLPRKGKLLVCTDLHGNLADLVRMNELFYESMEAGEDPFLLFTGDLIHGPDCGPEGWPEFLGEHYWDQSGDVLDEFIRLQRRYPTRVACLLGNHEHSHVGGPHTPKFWPDETVHFEETVGPERAEKYRRLFRSMPVVAISGCGVAVTHAAPNVDIEGPEDIEGIEYEGFEDLAIWSVMEMQLLGGLLWARTCSDEVARRFLAALGKNGPPLHLVIYGHEIVAAGCERVGPEQLIVSTSFGVARERKLYVKLDLAGRYAAVDSLRDGLELLRLYP